MELVSLAEKRAEVITKVEDFENFSLIGVREQIKQMVDLIGRVEGIFSTYTKHDISHINAMLNMLDWIIPEDTAKALTIADWLLIVLSIYLHDLGMAISKDEFDNRKKNVEFTKWFDSLDKSLNGRDYLARTKKMTGEEKDKFFFQEFIRMKHPQRISDWIKSRASSNWGKDINPIAENINEILKNVPPRFRESLALVCESHHKDNLDDISLYRLCEQCGRNIQQGIINIQYASIILRTVDLLHITKDRTPSIMYKVIGLTDPKGVEEWDKQIGTFAVRCKTRDFDINNPDSTIILVCADFTKEEPLFALQQYITYANNQINQSKIWADKSQKLPDAQKYSFPWTQIKGDVKLEGEVPKPLKFELDRGKLLNLLVGHTIYNDATVAVRELLQNAIDAVRYQYYLEKRDFRNNKRNEPVIGKVVVDWDPDNRILIIEDNGIGMDRYIIENHLMKVGASYYQTPKFRDEERDFTPISRFGIGILTCFMVSEDFEIITYKEQNGYRIRMTTVEVDYLLRELDSGDIQLKGLPPHGTRVKLKLRDTVDLSKKSIEDIIRYWIIMPECEVEYTQKGKDVKKIGFNSPEEALLYYKEVSRENVDNLDKWVSRKQSYITKTKEVVDKEQPNLNPATYQLSYCVEPTWSQEKMFVSYGYQEIPSVCIEGIRVSNSLPWLVIDNSICAILSVRGDQKFKTTVSREGLEEDEKYDEVGAIILDMLSEHINDEVKRIKNKKGNPLSQASSASYWLSYKLRSACNKSKAKRYFDNLLMKIPSMVIEKTVPDENKGLKNIREMINQKMLAQEPIVWSLESRLIDSLGTISRDLGKELYLNEFLITLAPDLKLIRYSPLLPDAHIFKDILLESHYPQIVEFSIQRQQSATKWSKRLPDSQRSSIDILTLLGQKRWQEYRKFTNNIRRNIFVSEIKAEVSEIKGDSDVDYVKTRIIPILRRDSEIANTYIHLIESIYYIINNNKSYDVLNSTLLTTDIYLNSITQSDDLKIRFVYSNLRRKLTRDKAEINLIWKENLDKTRLILEEMHKECVLPDDILSFYPSVKGFDATRYWMDWWKKEDEFLVI